MKISLLPSLLIYLLLAASCRQETDWVNGLPCQLHPGERWSMVDTEGELLLPDSCFDKRPTAIVNGMFSLPDAEGFCQLYCIEDATRPASPRRFVRIGHFFEEVTWAQETWQSPLLLIDKQGRTVASTGQYPQYDIILTHNFSEGRALIATRNGKYGYMDTRGRVVVPPIYDRAYDFSNGLALVGMANREGDIGYQLITPEGNVRQAIQLDNCVLGQAFHQERLPFKNLYTKQCGYLGKEGKTLLCLPVEIQEAYSFRYGMATFQTATGTGILDLQGNIQVKAVCEDAIPLGDDRTGIRQKGLWAVADTHGEPFCTFRYDSIGHYYGNGLAIAREGRDYLFIDRQGNPVGTQRYAFIAEEAEAHKEIPQVFIRQTPPDATGTSEDAPEEQPRLKEKKREDTPVRSTIQPCDWEKVKQQSPFYEEASKLLSGKLEETDAGNRRMILNYVEHLRTSYTTKDIDFLEQLFSENALIVVGTVVHTTPHVENGYLPPAQVIYNVKSKRQYLDRLRQIFKANKSIRMQFSDFRILRHPTQPGIYGVSLRQKYASDLYSDDGYLFLLWDFRDETAPKIHVRTWQPGMLDNHTPLPESEIFGIQNFNLQ